MEPEDIEEAPYTEVEINEEINRYRSIVLSACSSLGNLQRAPATDSNAGISDTEASSRMEYVPSSDCLASLKDIKRYIQMDEQGDGKWVLQWLGEWEILKRDIIPIFTLSAKKLLPGPHQQNLSESDRDYLLKTIMMCVELFVFLTWSMDSESEEVKTRFIQILRAYKRAFANNDVIFSLLSVAIMYTRKSHNTDKEAMLVKGIMYVFRNILAIPDPLVSPTSRGQSQVEVHDTLIGVMDQELAVDFFLTLASSADQNRFRDLRPILLDIVYYLFYRVPVCALFSTKGTWFKGSEVKRLGRHSNFGGVYAVSTGEGTIMPVFSAREVLGPFANLFRKQATVQHPKSTDVGSVDRQWRMVNPESVPILRKVAAVFIESCFNTFVPVLFEDAKTNTASMKEQLPRLLYISAYFVDISLANPAIDLGCVCALVQTHVFGLVMRNTSDYLELKQWASLEPAMYCIQQILLTLAKMRGTKLDSLSENVLSNLLYDGDALDLFVKLCRVYKPTKNTREFLVQVAETAETFLTTLKAYAEKKGSIFVKRRVRRITKPSKENRDKDKEADGGGEGTKPEGEVEPDSAGVKSEDGTQETEDVEDENGEDNDDSDGSDDSDDSEENKAKEMHVEQALNLERYYRAFSVADVVNTYSHLLTPPLAMDYVYPMMYRAAITCGKPHLFFKRPILLRLLAVFDDRVTYPHRTEMIDLASWIFRQYITVINSPVLRHQYKAEDINNKLAMECLLTFLKDSRAGTRTKPVITRHLIELYASNNGEDQDADKNEQQGNGNGDAGGQEDTPSQQKNSEAQPTQNKADAVMDMDDDFDFDEVYNFQE